MLYTLIFPSLLEIIYEIVIREVEIGTAIYLIKVLWHLS